MKETYIEINKGENDVKKNEETKNKKKINIHDLFMKPKTLQWLKGKNCVESSISSRTPIDRLKP